MKPAKLSPSSDHHSVAGSESSGSRWQHRVGRQIAIYLNKASKGDSRGQRTARSVTRRQVRLSIKMRSIYTPVAVQRKWHEVRRYSRFHCNWRLTVTCFRGDTLTFWGRASDISEEGLAATIVGELNVKEVVSIHLNIPLAQVPLTVRAAVRHRNGFFCGFEFLTVSGSQREIIRNACETLAFKE